MPTTLITRVVANAITGTASTFSQVFDMIKASRTLGKAMIKLAVLTGIIEGASLSHCSFHTCLSRSWLLVNQLWFADLNGTFSDMHSWIETTVENAWRIVTRRRRHRSTMFTISEQLSGLDLHHDPMDTDSGDHATSSLSY